jgi:hypothetical protein
MRARHYEQRKHDGVRAPPRLTHTNAPPRRAERTQRPQKYQNETATAAVHTALRAVHVLVKRLVRRIGRQR